MVQQVRQAFDEPLFSANVLLDIVHLSREKEWYYLLACNSNIYRAKSEQAANRPQTTRSHK